MGALNEYLTGRSHTLREVNHECLSMMRFSIIWRKAKSRT